MSSNPKKKLCWNCEGRVSLSEENCPYCAVYLGPAPDENGENGDILAPPYRIVDGEEEEAAPRTPYLEEAAEGEQVLSGTKTDLREVVIPLGLLSAGSLALLFGILMLVFSQHGEFTLRWNGEYWYFYLLLSVPMLLFGWRALQRFEEGGIDRTDPVPLPQEKPHTKSK